MTPPDRPNAPMPVRHTQIVAAPAAHDLLVGAADAGEPQGSGRKITLRLVGRALRRHWWQAALVWVIGSIGLMCLAYVKVKPTYEARARIRVEPGERALFVQTSGTSEFAEYKETQVAAITSPVVIAAALEAHPELRNYPKLKGADDPIVEIKTLLFVGIVPKTNYIDILMSSELSMEAVAIVNAVADAYVRGAKDINTSESQAKIDNLKVIQAEKDNEVKLKRGAIKQQQEKQGAADVKELKDKNAVTLDGYRALNDQLTKVQIEILKSEAQIQQLQNDQPATPAVAGPAEATKEQVSQLFYEHPKVMRVKERLDAADDRYKAAKEKVRDRSDPSLLVPLRARQAAQAELDALWAQLSPVLAEQARNGVRAGGVAPDTTMRAVEGHLAALKAEEAGLTNKLNALSVTQRENGANQVTLEFDRMDLARAEKYLETVDQNLQQMEFENRSPLARIRLEYRARPSARASSSSRTKIMAIAPVGMLFGVLCLLVLLELHAGRVVDPEDIPLRVRVPVIGVVPPLPQVRPQGALSSARDEFRTQRQLDQFVQSLDHLRVTLCTGRNAWGRDRRVILITSACASEGKTTLAAQLAERCVNAGLHTLLIDGDLRNPTLSRMLDVPTGKGLINVLRGEATPDEAMVVVGGGGGFHFMPSGTPKVDPSRLLHGERLGKLLAQARESFDIVIVDAPPVLPVPDALTIGRWTDGAVLAVRYDMSRFPLVEKANRRLASVGVSVIGAVVNGVRIADSTYGSYYPSYDYGNERAAQAPLDV